MIFKINNCKRRQREERREKSEDQERAKIK